MIYTHRIKRRYEKIQNKLFYIIPEKWDRVYLYASVAEQMEGILTGEMYFYYFPKGLLKMRPINVYEIPNKFNITEEAYTKHLEELYEDIKELWKDFVSEGHKPWYSITISIEDFKFKIEYNYTDISTLPYSGEQRHIIWCYKNLKRDIEVYTKRQRRCIERYLSDNPEQEIEVHEEAVYRNPIHNVIEYEKEENTYIEQESEEPEVVINNEILLKNMK